MSNHLFEQILEPSPLRRGQPGDHLGQKQHFDIHGRMIGEDALVGYLQIWRDLAQTHFRLNNADNVATGYIGAP